MNTSDMVDFWYVMTKAKHPYLCECSLCESVWSIIGEYYYRLYSGKNN